MRNAALVDSLPTATVGGMRVCCLGRRETVELMGEVIEGRRPGVVHPLFMTSANGQVLSMYARSARVRAAYDAADVISADGQSVVAAARLLARNKIRDRSCTTDLVDDAGRMLPPGTRFFFFGAAPHEIERAVARFAATHPHIDLVGYSHGYLSPDQEETLLQELERKRPDVLWIGLGVPRQQEFVNRHIERLGCVKVVKTCGGLFNYMSGTVPRAPLWMRRAGLEWAFRLAQEPRRLAWRYLVTNPHSFYLLLTRTR